VMREAVALLQENSLQYIGRLADNGSIPFEF
jgi:hypothetical protein